MSLTLLQRLRGDGYLAWRAGFIPPLKKLFSVDRLAGAVAPGANP